MSSQRGFSLMELVVIVAVIGVVAAVGLPGMKVVLERNRVITSSELVSGQIREARLAAITRNARFRVQFNCPDRGALRILAVTNNAAIDNADDRCVLNQPNDGPAVYLPPDVRFGQGDNAPATLEISGRGQISAVGGAMPSTIAVSYGSYTRILTVTASGRVRTPTS